MHPTTGSTPFVPEYSTAPIALPVPHPVQDMAVEATVILAVSYMQVKLPTITGAHCPSRESVCVPSFTVPAFAVVEEIPTARALPIVEADVRVSEVPVPVLVCTMAGVTADTLNGPHRFSWKPTTKTNAIRHVRYKIAKRRLIS